MSAVPRILTSLSAVALAVPVLLSAQTTKPIARFSATAVNLDAPTGRATGPVDILVTRWSTDAERDQLTTAMLEHGSTALLDALIKMPPVGSIRTPDSVGYDLRFARRQPLGTGDQIVLVTARPLSFWERRQGPPSNDYPFTMIELRVGANGEGEGKISSATRVVVDNATKMMRLEDWNVGPVLLQKVRTEK